MQDIPKLVSDHIIMTQLMLVVKLDDGFALLLLMVYKLLVHILEEILDSL